MDINLVGIVSADGLVPLGARPSADAMITTQIYTMQFLWLQIISDDNFLTRQIIKMEDEIFNDFSTHHRLMRNSLKGYQK